MCGEITVKIDKIETSSISEPFRFGSMNPCVDLTIKDSNNNYLHICGNNDWGYLALEILNPIKESAENLIEDVKERIARIGDKPEVIMLGINQQRIMDIYHGGKGKCTEISGIPIARTEKLKEFRFCGNIHDKGIDENNVNAVCMPF